MNTHLAGCLVILAMWSLIVSGCTSTPTVVDKPALELRSANISASGTKYVVTGAVANISDRPLVEIRVTVTIPGGLLSTAVAYRAPIDAVVLAAGRSTTFQVEMDKQPEGFSVGFEDKAGAPVAYRDARQVPIPQYAPYRLHPSSP